MLYEEDHRSSEILNHFVYRTVFRMNVLIHHMRLSRTEVLKQRSRKAVQRNTEERLNPQILAYHDPDNKFQYRLCISQKKYKATELDTDKSHP